MNVLGYSGLHQSVPFKKRALPGLEAREYRVAQGFDAAAALVRDSSIVAAAAEERFTREKTTGAFPAHAIKYCLAAGGLAPADVDFVAHAFSYESYRELFAADDLQRRQFDEVYSPAIQRRNLEEFLPGWGWDKKLIPVEHHRAHAASAFYPSGFPEALILVSDGMGEAHSMTVAVGQGTKIEVLRQAPAMHSLGILYSVFTLYLGFDFGVDEYKVMGLAPCGDPRRFFRQVSELVQLEQDGTYAIPLFAANRDPLEKETHRGVLRELENRFGPRRAPRSEIGARERDLAAALQAVLQNCQMRVLRHFRRETGMENVCLAGGVALNCSANGVIHRSRLFRRMFIQPAAGDDGSALGAALSVAAEHNPAYRPSRMGPPLWGPEFDTAEIQSILSGREDCRANRVESFPDLCREVARRLADGQIIGWFQGRMEFGPRALGNRSILADPRDPAMRDRINALVKKRESFRPFAPVARSEAASRHFDLAPGEEDIFAHMLVVASVRREFRNQLPAVTHVDGSARVQTVSRDDYPRLWELLGAFEETTGLPVLLNTSFNVKGQPIVCAPAEALDTFLFTGLDALVLGDFVVTPASGQPRQAARDSAGGRIVVGVG